MNSDPAQEWALYREGMLRLPSSIVAKIGRFTTYAGRITALASGSSSTVNIPIEPDTDFLVDSVEIIPSLQTTLDDVGTVQIQDNTYNNVWSSAPVPLRDAAGFGFESKKLPYPQLVMAASSLNVTVTNSSGSSMDYYISFKGYRMVGLQDFERQLLAKRQFFQYVMSVPTITAGAITTPVSMQIQGDADFLLKRFLSWEAMKAIYTGTLSSGTAEIMGILRDTSSGYQFNNTMESLRSLFGAKRLLYVTGGSVYGYGTELEIPIPYLTRRNATIDGQFQNLGGASTGLFRLIFEGAKIID